jgi:hydroxymethylpyrimidine pyrophosphatase-like HAD family hydrolase
MFNYDQKFSQEEISSGASRIKESGCYIVTIEFAELFKNTNTKSEAINLNIVTEEEEKARLSIFYKDKNGANVDFNNKHLTHLVDLLKLNPLSLQPVKNQDDKLHIPVLENKIVGVFLTYEGMKTATGTDGKEYENAQYNLRGFFDPATRRTIKEINDNVACSMFQKWEHNFEKENSIRERKEEEAQHYSKTKYGTETESNAEDTIDDDDFPF